MLTSAFRTCCLHWLVTSIFKYLSTASLIALRTELFGQPFQWMIPLTGGQTLITLYEVIIMIAELPCQLFGFFFFLFCNIYKISVALFLLHIICSVLSAKKKSFLNDNARSVYVDSCEQRNIMAKFFNSEHLAYCFLLSGRN